LPSLWTGAAGSVDTFLLDGMIMSTLDPSAAFTPTSRVLDPPHRPEQLADAVLASLSRPMWGYRYRPWGVIKTFVLAAITLGLLPLLVWQKRFRHLMIVEQQQLWHLAEWLRLRTGRPQATALRDESSKLNPSPLTPIIWTGLTALAVVSWIYLIHYRYFEFRTFWMIIYGFEWHDRWGVWREPYLNFWKQWTVLLSAGYFIHWFQVCRRSTALEEYAAKFNAVMAAEGVPPVRVRGVGIGFHPFWAIAAIIALSRGVIWAVPMAMAGVVHARYVRLTFRHTRSEFARRVRWMLASHRPALNVRATPAAEPLVCANEKCRAAIPPGAVFCPRCGARV
jgi:hypothetical protein